jgi:hypothetical protein
LEKAQDRKKKMNLEGGKGNSKSYNPFSVLSHSDIAQIAKDVGVSLGSNQIESDLSILEVQNSDLVRSFEFEKGCDACHVENSGRTSLEEPHVSNGVDAPCTPVAIPGSSQMGGVQDASGQWTHVVNRKKTKSRFQDERNFLEC